MRSLGGLVLAGVLGALLLPLAQGGSGFLLIPLRYKGEAVVGGGSIEGTVTVDPVPTVPEMEINKDESVCEHAKTSPRLVVDRETKGLGNVVVYLDGIQKGKPRESGEFVIDQKNCQFAPHISIVPIRSTLHFKSSDDVLHNVHAYKGTPEAPHSMTKDVVNLAFKDSAVEAQPFDRRALRRPGFYYLKCDAGHYWMSAYVWVVEHPYYAVTDAKGKFALTDVPPGSYTLRFWHENWEAKPVRDKQGKVREYAYSAPLMHSVRVEVKTGRATKALWVCTG